MTDEEMLAKPSRHHVAAAEVAKLGQTLQMSVTAAEIVFCCQMSDVTFGKGWLA